MNLKIALAKKQGDSQQELTLTEQLKEDIKKIETEQQERQNERKSEIKEKYNQLCQSVQLAVDEFVRACVEANHIKNQEA